MILPPSRPAEYLEGLERFGWFERLPLAAAEAMRDGVTKAVAASANPWVGLVCAAADSAYLLEERPYAALLLQFAKASHGVFAPEQVREQPERNGVRLSFRSNARDYATSLPAEPFEVPDTFFERINDAIESSGTALRFLRMYELGWGPVPGFTLTTPAAYRKAVSGKWIPAEDPKPYSPEVLAAFAALGRGKRTRRA